MKEQLLKNVIDIYMQAHTYTRTHAHTHHNTHTHTNYTFAHTYKAKSKAHGTAITSLVHQHWNDWSYSGILALCGKSFQDKARRTVQISQIEIENIANPN